MCKFLNMPLLNTGVLESYQSYPSQEHQCQMAGTALHANLDIFKGCHLHLSPYPSSLSLLSEQYQILCWLRFKKHHVGLSRSGGRIGFVKVFLFLPFPRLSQTCSPLPISLPCPEVPCHPQNGQHGIGLPVCATLCDTFPAPSASAISTATKQVSI